MPTYEYKCKSCGHSFDVVQSMRDDTLTVCPECGGELRKVFAPPAISFKGSGFYATDHRKKGSSSSEKSETSEKKDDKKAETKLEKSDAGSGDSGSRKTDQKTDQKTEKKSETKSEKKTESKPAASSSSKAKD
jgi:putative FmdB family regulatory protein